MLDPSITLFGRKIKLKGSNIINKGITKVDEFGYGHNNNNDTSFDDQLENEVDKEITEEESLENDQQDDEYLAEDMDESTNASAISETTIQAEKPIDSESQQDKKQSKDSQQKLLKKPDKILPCPRCNSMDTKFCYYNNYNVNQPRHFCKSCQRYWTAGGTMRNVPVGAGRRKNKNSASRYCHVTMSEAIQSAKLESLDVSSETLLTFGSDNKIKIPDKTVISIEKQIPGYQFPCMWNPAIPVPAQFCPGVFPVPISPIYQHPSLWNVPWVLPHCLSTQNIPSSPNLGKHTRDGEMLTPTTVLMPKTLRIDNPDEAAKSSIWSTLGIKKDNKSDCVSKGFFSNFQPKEVDEKDGEVDASSGFVTANPVALCRSIDFQERAN